MTTKQKGPIIIIGFLMLLVGTLLGMVLMFAASNKGSAQANKPDATEITQTSRHGDPSCACDADRFKNEYESLNGKDTGYDGKKYTAISIPKDNPIEYVDYTRVKQTLMSGTGVIYFGFPECPWCRSLVPVLIDAADEYGIDNIMYFNNKSERNAMHLDDDGNVVIDSEGTEDYKELLDLLGDYASVYKGLDDESIKRLYFPTVVFVKDGEIVYFHEDTVDSQEDPYVMLDADQQKELKGIMREGFAALYPQRCSVDEKGC